MFLPAHLNIVYKLYGSIHVFIQPLSPKYWIVSIAVYWLFKNVINKPNTFGRYKQLTFKTDGEHKSQFLLSALPKQTW